jgi:hypothetical protein
MVSLSWSVHFTEMYRRSVCLFNIAVSIAQVNMKMNETSHLDYRSLCWSGEHEILWKTVIFETCTMNQIQQNLTQIDHGMARLQVADGGDGLHTWRIAVNILNNQLHTAEKGWSCRLGVCVCEAWGCNNNPSPHKNSKLRNVTHDLGGFC